MHHKLPKANNSHQIYFQLINSLNKLLLGKSRLQSKDNPLYILLSTII